MKVNKIFIVKIFSLLIMLIIVCSCTSSEKIKTYNRNIIVGHIEENKLIYSNWNNHIVVEDLINLDTMFIQRTTDVCHVNPLTKGDFIYFKNSDKSFRCVNYRTQNIIWQLQTDNKVNNFVILNDSIGLLDIKNSGIIGINILNGKQLYNIKYEYAENNCFSPTSSPYNIFYDNEKFYINDWACKTLVAFNLNNGNEMWSIILDEGISKSILSDDNIFIGIDNYYEGGQIYVLDSSNGKIIHKHNDIHIFLRTNPILWKDKVIYYDYFEDIIKEYNFQNNSFAIVKRFVKSSQIVGQFFLINDLMYYQDSDYNIKRINLESLKEVTLLESKRGGFSTIYISPLGREVVFY